MFEKYTRQVISQVMVCVLIVIIVSEYASSYSATIVVKYNLLYYFAESILTFALDIKS